MATVQVSWWHTEHFTASIEVDDDFDIEADDADEKLEEIICNMSGDLLADHFVGCTEREITEKEMV
ncbi:hypothetical protein SEA_DANIELLEIGNACE_69 [Arthrobacter phage DanielleIgnace]|nr:hypothetical protein SEA_DANIELLEIGNACE_69 [Arthrobacter phage DanielleIgnace]